ncbi:hypothetical protein E3Q15_03281 [Wallemia mellicola]|nr:hypothetical protein E3Q15_03281 [Wallemia mellicola]TIC52256.1 hypothetical protein E3Q05_02782 [Wallemia mellicola]TIC73308.1 hypothetical protein E3Q00_03054 [Wallemia mellicola]
MTGPLPTLEPRALSSLTINQKSILELNGEKDLFVFKLDNIACHKPTKEVYEEEASDGSSKSQLVASKYITNSSTPSQMTNRQPLACTGCRKQKLKCLGGKPCQRCNKRGIECVYDSVIRRRGPDKVAGGRLKSLS